jgi:hypothetical protein
MKFLPSDLGLVWLGLTSTAGSGSCSLRAKAVLGGIVAIDMLLSSHPGCSLSRPAGKKLGFQECWKQVRLSSVRSSRVTKTRLCGCVSWRDFAKPVKL